MSELALRMTVLPGSLAVVRLPANAPWPDWAQGAFVSLTRTRDELSVVCDEACVPAGLQSERGRRALMVAGPLDLGLVGILARIAGVLAAAGVPIFVVSTFDTDYVLVAEDRLDVAVAALGGEGIAVDT